MEQSRIKCFNHYIMIKTLDNFIFELPFEKFNKFSDKKPKILYGIRILKVNFDSDTVQEGLELLTDINKTINTSFTESLKLLEFLNFLQLKELYAKLLSRIIRHTLNKFNKIVNILNVKNTMVHLPDEYGEVVTCITGKELLKFADF